ncbi:MAG: Holliday junction branch migration protein RuvA [Acidimicrobiales bacterium]
MIGSLRGRLLEREVGATREAEVLVEVAGVGYRVTVTPSTAVTFGDPGEDVFVHVHHHVREDAQTLYGFATKDERVAFEALLGAHGVGPALALAILSVHSPESLRRTLADDDLSSLCLVPGVGRKTAARLLIELKTRLDVPIGESIRSTVAEGASPTRSARLDVRDALDGLGYGPEETRSVLAELPDDGDTSLLLKQALQRLALSSRSASSRSATSRA